MFAVDLNNLKTQKEKQDGGVDALTGLLNRERFLEKVGERLNGLAKNRARLSGMLEQNNSQLIIVWFDLSNFKGFNAKFGFQVGDEFLQKTADSITSVFAGDLASRFSDDHFVIFTARVGLEQRLERLQSVLAQNSNSFHSVKVLCKLRAGIYTPTAQDKAEIACDRAKLACDSLRSDYSVDWKFYEPTLSSRVSLQHHIVGVLNRVIEHGDIRVYYQPIVRALTGNVCSAEALVRWTDAQYGMISPGDFVRTLERCRLVHKLDVYMIRHICADYRQQAMLGRRMMPTSVNLSRLDFDLCDIFAEVDRAVNEFGVPKEMLKIEITRNSHGKNFHLMDEGIKKFKDNGYEVWLDGFSSGYSSFNILGDYNFDTIKFDLRALSDFYVSQKSRLVLNSNLSMVKKMGAQPLAKGVEKREQLPYLQDIGFGKLQGYLFSRPVPLGDVFNLPFNREDSRDTAYYDKISSVDLPNQESFSYLHRSGCYTAADARAMALAELCDGEFSLLAKNDVFGKWLESIGVVTDSEVHDLLNSTRGGLKALAFKDKLLAAAACAKELGETGAHDSDDTESGFYIFWQGNTIHVQLIHVATNSRTGTDAYIISHSNVTRFPRHKANAGTRLKDALSKMFDGLIDMDFSFMTPDPA